VQSSDKVGNSPDRALLAPKRPVRSGLFRRRILPRWRLFGEGGPIGYDSPTDNEDLGALMDATQKNYVLIDQIRSIADVLSGDDIRSAITALEGFLICREAGLDTWSDPQFRGSF